MRSTLRFNDAQSIRNYTFILGNDSIYVYNKSDRTNNPQESFHKQLNKYSWESYKNGKASRYLAFLHKIIKVCDNGRLDYIKAVTTKNVLPSALKKKTSICQATSK